MRKSKDFKATKMAFMYKYRTNALYVHLHLPLDVNEDTVNGFMVRFARMSLRS